MEESRKPQIALTDEQRMPLIENSFFLNELRQDSYAPNFNFQSGDRLNVEHLKRVHNYKKQIGQRELIHDDKLPKWLIEFVKDCKKYVPYYQATPDDFISHPTLRRETVRTQPWNFVSEKANLDDLLVYHTSGTTGPPLDVNFDPVAQASWIPQIESILNPMGVNFSYDRKRVAIALICNQQSTLTYASLSSYLEGSGVLKINLNPDDWNDPLDCVKYLERYNPEVLTGDPFSFLSLKKFNPKIKPKALISSAMRLLPAMETELKEHFKCPVIDLYSLTECRNIAFKNGDEFETIRPDLYLEVFDPIDDKLLTPGEHGEIVVTGGNNPFLPLIRYRTGDYGKLRVRNGKQYIYDMETREPVILYTDNGDLLNNIDVSRALVDLPLAGFELRQRMDNSVHFKGWADAEIASKIKDILSSLFGGKCAIEVEILAASKMDGCRKLINFCQER